MHQARIVRSFATWAVLGCVSISTLSAQETSPAVYSSNASSISVVGRGKVKGPATTVELVGSIASEAELAGDALTKFLLIKEASVSAVKKLGIENIQIETGGFALGPPGSTNDLSATILARSRGAAPEPPKLAVQESLRVRLTQIDKLDHNKLLETLAKIVDAAKEAGVAFGPAPGTRVSISSEGPPAFATFSIDDASQLREKAETMAMEDARAKATRLAKLSGNRLGDIRSVQESQLYSASLRSLPPEMSSKLDEIEINVTLQVSFQIVRGGATEK